MSNINEVSRWEPTIDQVDDSDRVKGGESGVINIQAAQLAARTNYLKNLFDTLMGMVTLGEGPYTSVEQAQADIDRGKIPEAMKFSVRSIISGHWVDEYSNTGGIATPTGEFLPSGESIISALGKIDATNQRVDGMMRLADESPLLSSDEYMWGVSSAAGTRDIGMALDKDWGLMLAELPRAVQEYLVNMLPESLSNRYSGVRWAVGEGTTGELVLLDNGDFYIPGVALPLQDALGQSSAQVKSHNGTPALFWNGVPVWTEKPVISANKMTESGCVFSYQNADGSTGAGLLFVPSIREIPVSAAYILLYICLGQSLGAAYDKPGKDIRIVGADPELRGRCLSPAGRADGNSGSWSQQDLERTTDMAYNKDRQGHNIPLANGLMYEMRDAGMNLPTIINAPCNAGGQPFSGISAGTPAYIKSMKMVEYITTFAAGVGKPVNADFVLFEHGETNNDNGSCRNPGDYDALMTPYMDDSIPAFKAITGQQNDICIVVGQVGSRINTKAGAVDAEGNPTGETVIVQPYSVAAVDQMTYVRRNANAIMYGSKYMLNHLFSDGSLSHLNEKGKVIQGEMIEKAIFWHLYDNNKKGTWTGNRVKKITITDNIIDIERDVPFPPLVIDTAMLGDCENYGHSLENESAIIERVDIIDEIKVRLTLDKAPSPTDHLLIGFNNRSQSENGYIYPRTCVRDSSPWVSRYVKQNDDAFPIYNWAVLERIPLTGEL
ncbi:hypothetical protein RG289_003116 [Serratia marcescens]|uniref:hypothetical protein n=1 Tax=Serratia marcescens TaxID=615 RepID=UPI00074565B1|nr:hypothetical protein [Serratia marcescens]CUY74698.1 Uncharacterised protein [Serratia marcescens]CUY80797.1 Uncharacterised protein [Serratia marcescens]HBC7422364.1 hypothetical protein [Serratia marcescens]